VTALSITQEFLPEYTNGVNQVLKIENNAFTRKKLYEEITNEEHLTLALIFSFIAISLLENPEFNIYAKAIYGIEFSGEIDGRRIRLNRSCMISLSGKQKPTHLIDLWTDLSLNGNTSDYVRHPQKVKKKPKVLKNIDKDVSNLCSKKYSCARKTPYLA